MDNPNNFYDGDGDPFISVFSFCDCETNQMLTPEDALDFSYKWLSEHSGYKDCADYLANFIVLDDVLTKITKQTTDAFGQVTESVYATYYYDKNGECFQFSDLYKTFEFVNVLNITEGYIKECRYNDDGKLISADLYHKYNTSVIGTRVIFIYDEMGNIIEAEFISSNGSSKSNTFTYNESNQLIAARYETVCDFGFTQIFIGTYYKFQYEYTEQGQLSKIMIESSSSPDEFNVYCEYIYNEGKIKEIQYSDYKDVYTYNENGQIAYIESIPTGTGLQYKLIYHYEDVVRYNHRQ